MNQTDFNKLVLIRKLLKESYDNYFAKGDGHCKSGEGHISVEFGNYWQDKQCQMKITSINIYSYVFGSGRVHYFDTIDEALDTVVRWHKEEMEHDYEKAEKEEQEYWDNYFKKHPEEKISLINPDAKTTGE